MLSLWRTASRRHLLAPTAWWSTKRSLAVTSAAVGKNRLENTTCKASTSSPVHQQRHTPVFTGQQTTRRQFWDVVGGWLHRKDEEKCDDEEKFEDADVDTETALEILPFVANGADKTRHHMQLTFLGTGAMAPTISRGTSSVALKIGSDAWLFDCGEGTQRQMIRCGNLRPSSIKKIFITHTHGDHIFGLAGIMCDMIASAKEDQVLDIFGPRGLQEYLRVSMNVSRSQLSYRYRVHEFVHTLPKEPAKLNRFELPPRYLLPDAQGVWSNLCQKSGDEEATAEVHAVKIDHKDIPCFGYVVHEFDFPGSMDPTYVKPLLRRPEVRDYVMNKYKVTSPEQVLKFLKDGASIKISDTESIHPQDVLGPNKRGRKIAILGDTRNPLNVASLAAGADVLIHECTNAFLDNFRSLAVASTQDAIKLAYARGHSTPEMAGAFAKAIGANALLMNHISPRFSGDGKCGVQEAAEVGLVDLARAEFDGDVRVVRDLQTFDIPVNNTPALSHKERVDQATLAKKRAATNLAQLRETVMYGTGRAA